MDIEGGIDWSNKIKEEISNSEIVIALITEAVFKSKYIPDEIKYAINKQKLVIPCVRTNVDLSKLSSLGLTKEHVIVFNDNEMGSLYGKINDSIASYKKNPKKVKEYYEKRRKQKRIKIAISAIASSVFILVMLTIVLHPQHEENYVFKKSWGNLSTNNLELNLPSSVAVDSKGNLYVADTGNHRIQKIQPEGNVTVIGKKGKVLGEFDSPFGVAIDSKDNLYVADTGNHRIQKIHADGNVISIGEKGSDLKFISPYGVAIDSKDNLYVTDTENNRIQKISPDWIVTSIDRFGSLGELYLPSGVAIDSKDNLYVTDTGNNRIQ